MDLHPLPKSRARRWLYALKPASWPKLLVPMLLGQGLGIASAGRPSAGALAFGVVFTLLDLAFIVLMNDWADRRVDAIKRRMFPEGGSPKTIPDGVLRSADVLLGGMASGLAALVASSLSAWLLHNSALLWAGPLCLLLFFAYSLPPLRLNYRGGGEVLEMLGVGLALPWLNALAQSGRLWTPELLALPGFIAMSLASAVASGLGDERSDRAGGKRTVVTMIGNRPARALVEALVPFGAGLWILCALLSPALSFFAALPASAVTLWSFRTTRQRSAAATTDAFAAQGAYKLALHRAIWWGGALFGVLLALWRLSGR